MLWGAGFSEPIIQALASVGDAYHGGVRGRADRRLFPPTSDVFAAPIVVGLGDRAAGLGITG
jgi:hypothetical protein